MPRSPGSLARPKPNGSQRVTHSPTRHGPADRPADFNNDVGHFRSLVRNLARSSARHDQRPRLLAGLSRRGFGADLMRTQCHRGCKRAVRSAAAGRSRRADTMETRSRIRSRRRHAGGAMARLATRAAMSDRGLASLHSRRRSSVFIDFARLRPRQRVAGMAANGTGDRRTENRTSLAPRCREAVLTEAT